MKALIINFNRLTLPIKLAGWLSKRGCEVIFIDNNSDYPPLLEYYRNSPFEVLKLKNNFGHTVLWNYPVLETLGIQERFIYTDPDLNLEGVPDNFLEVLHEGLDKYDFPKCGLSLEINDLPNSDEGNFIKEIEQVYWQEPLDDMYFKAAVDTTLAMYRFPIEPYSHSAIRTNRPYTCRHVPWYYADADMNLLPADEKYYYNTANYSSSHKERLVKNGIIENNNGSI